MNEPQVPQSTKPNYTLNIPLTILIYLISHISAQVPIANSILTPQLIHYSPFTNKNTKTHLNFLLPNHKRLNNSKNPLNNIIINGKRRKLLSFARQR